LNTLEGIYTRKMYVFTEKQICCKIGGIYQIIPNKLFIKQGVTKIIIFNGYPIKIHIVDVVYTL